jgi:ssDNA-binding Zn-finger/Zn-ribbon topoisomerase 1
VNERKKVRCPACGAEMNFHAEKIDYSLGSPDSDESDPDLGGVLVEFHTCPVCRFVLERPAG